MNKEMVVFCKFEACWFFCEVIRKTCYKHYFSFFVDSSKNEMFKLERQNFHLITWSEDI